MAKQDIQLNQRRLERLATARAKDLDRSIDIESESWNDLVEGVRTGRPRLMGEDDPVLIINMAELEALIQDVLKPENWGEYFLPSPHQVSDSDPVLTVPPSKGGAVHDYEIDFGEDD